MKTSTNLDGSACFHRVGQVEFWLTPLNRVFLVIGEHQVFPSLQGGSVVKFDDPTYVPEDKVLEDLRRILRKQREIRQDWPTPEEDAVAYEFS